MSTSSTVAAPVPSELNLFCAREGGAYRVYLRRSWAPRYLRQCFDENAEAYPVELDLDDLDAHMARHGASYEKRPTRLGGVELTARGEAAGHLAVWLSTAFATGVRPRSGP